MCHASYFLHGYLLVSCVVTTIRSENGPCPLELLAATSIWYTVYACNLSRVMDNTELVTDFLTDVSLLDSLHLII
jgi:hypothetical protein